jgi:hypothetical protein
MKSIPQKSNCNKRQRLFGLIQVVMFLPVLLAAGCKTIQCAPALSCEKQPVDKVAYPKIWTSGKYDSFQLVVTNGPYRIKDSSIEHLKNAVKEKAGLDIEVVEGTSTGLPADHKVENKEILAAGLRQIPSSDKPVVVVVVVNGVTGVDYDYKGIIYCSQSHLRKLARENTVQFPPDLSHEASYFAVLILNRSHLVTRLAEDLILIHEIGHWFGVPAREFHTSCDRAHCTNGRCIMFAGRVDFPTLIRLVAVNLLGLTNQYGPDCMEELAEMQRQRQANKEKLNAK